MTDQDAPHAEDAFLDRLLNVPQLMAPSVSPVRQMAVIGAASALSPSGVSPYTSSMVRRTE